MLRRLPAAVLAALFIFGAIAAPAPARAAAIPTSAAPEPFDSLTVRFAYNTTVGTAISDDGKTRQIDLQPGQDAETALAAWEQATGVIGVIPDIQAVALIDPVDPLYASQWDMHAPTSGKEGASNAAATWSTTTGAGVVVAVLDTGQINHPDLIANMPEGWGVDMIENPVTSRDGDGRDMNPTDEGDWCSYPSSWHGTHVAGTIGAAQNDTGISGVAPNVSILHVRVLGRCGGSFNDVIDGIRWAAGLSTTWDGQQWSNYGLTVNAHPADVINMSLGGGSACWGTLQTAITQARAAGTVVVTAAGNSTVDAASFTPANCNDTVTVAATGRVGGLAGYSNFGSSIDIAAPGGDMPRDSGILSTVATGAETATGYSYANYHGTSMAAPHVAGVAALVASQHPTWGPAEIEAAIYAGARPFPNDTVRPCVTRSETPTGAQRQCGVGLLDAVGALDMAQPTLTITAPSTLAVGESATVSATSDLPGEVTLTVATESATKCVLTGATLSTISTGTCTLVATTPAAVDHVAGSASHAITITGTPQVINFGPGPLFDPATVQFSSTQIPLSAIASSGLPVGYRSETPAVCEVTAQEGVANAWRVRLLNLGTCTILAMQEGNAVYDPAPSVERSFTITQGSQVIDLGTLSNRAFDPSNVQGLPQYSSAGLPLNYSGLTSDVCQPQFNGTFFQLVAFTPGICTIRAEQSGSSTYMPATPVTRTFELYKLQQTPLFFEVGRTAVPINSRTGYGYGGGSTVSAVTIRTLTSRICTVSGRTIRYVAAGTCILEATKAGDARFYATSKTIRVTVFTPARLTAQPRVNQIGKIAYGTKGTWVGGPTPTFKYQWYSCTTGSRTKCTVISGATSLNLSVTSAVAGKYAFLRVYMYQAGFEYARTDSNVIKISAK